MSIPASQIVSVNPGVISAGGNSLALNGLFLTQNTLMPAGAVRSFGSVAAVAAFFGAGSDEAALAAIYFAGFDNSTVKPGQMLFAPYNATVRAAFLTSGSLAGVTLTALKAMSGVLTMTIDGVSKTSTTINLSGATSFSNAATLIAAGFTGGPTVTWNAQNNTFVFTSSTTGLTSQVSFATGTLATGLALTQAAGAYQSVGAIADTPATAMVEAVSNATNFVSVVTLWEPDTATKTLFAQWFAVQNSRYLDLIWDTDVQASTQGSTTSFGYLAGLADYDGIALISGDPSLPLATNAREAAAFVSGAIASMDFSRTNGRITLAGRSQAGLPITNADATLAQNLLANGYSFYGSYATANQGFVMFQNGQLPGKWAWIDTFVSQVYLNSQMQLALMTLINQQGIIPYNPDGYGAIRNTIMGPVKDALNWGGIRSGVTLSNAQLVAVNTAAGLDVSSPIQTQGYYLQVLDPGAAARGLRKTPIINLWYTDGGAVQQISLASVDIQ